MLFCCNTQRSNHLLAHCPLLGQCSSPKRESEKKKASNLSTRTKSSLSLFISTPICLQVYAACYTLPHSSRISNWITSLARLQVINPSKSYTGKMFHNLRLQSLRNLENLRLRGPSAMAKASKGAMGPRKSKQKTSSGGNRLARKCRWLDRKDILVQKHLVCKSQRN